jgi:1-aminocyclopropane-1-carboxylate deaminase
MNKNQTAIAYAVLKDKSLTERIQGFINKEGFDASVKIEEADFGGYAKLDKALLDFILRWLDETGILLDPIYTSKMCMRLMQQVELDEFKKGSSITMLHSGGLQGWRGMRKRVVQLSGEATWDMIQSKLDR